MSLFYVYMRWVRPQHNRSGDWSRQLLTCESRYIADEFFRGLQDLRSQNGEPRFVLLERDTPQFWRYDTTDGNPGDSIASILNQNRGQLPVTVQGRIMSTLLHDGPGREWPVAPVIAGPDWIHGRTYFIRNIRQPDLYWYHGEANKILVSDSQRTKFRVTSKDSGSNKGKVLIRSDLIYLEVVTAGGGGRRYVKANENRLEASADAATWTFSDLLGSFGSSWAREMGTVREYVTWSLEGELDEWELC